MPGKSSKPVNKTEAKKKKKSDNKKKQKNDFESCVVNEKQKKKKNYKENQDNTKSVKKQKKKKAKYEIKAYSGGDGWTGEKTAEKSDNRTNSKTSKSDFECSTVFSSNPTLVLALVAFVMIAVISVLVVYVDKNDSGTKSTNTTNTLTVTYPEDKLLAIYSPITQESLKYSRALVIDYQGVETSANYVDNDEKSNSLTRCSFVFQGQIWFLGIVSTYKALNYSFSKINTNF